MGKKIFPEYQLKDFHIDEIEINRVDFCDGSTDFRFIQGKIYCGTDRYPFEYYHSLVSFSRRSPKLNQHQMNELKESIIHHCKYMFDIKTKFQELLGHPKVYSALCFIVGVLFLMLLFR